MVHVSGREFSCARNTTLLSRAEPQFYHRMLETGSDNWWSPRPHPPSRGGQCLAWFPGIEGRSVHLWSASPSPSTPTSSPTHRGICSEVCHASWPLVTSGPLRPIRWIRACLSFTHVPQNHRQLDGASGQTFLPQTLEPLHGGVSPRDSVAFLFSCVSF